MSRISLKPEFTFDDVLLLPRHSNFAIGEESKVDLRTKLSKTIDLDIPILSSPMAGVTEFKMAQTIASLGGLGVIHPFQSFEEQLDQVSKVKKRNLKVGAAVIDFSDSGFKHCASLLKAGADVISLESPHADNVQTLNFIGELKKKFQKIHLSVAHVVTADATEAVIKAGADSVRVGIGGGSHCTTRLITGVGRPQLSAVLECAKITQKYKVGLISDTGIRYPGDIVKAIACGADTVMIGSLFAATDEAPGEIITRKGMRYKMSWGSNTETVMLGRQNENSSLYTITSLVNLLRSIKRSILNKETKNKSIPLEEGVEGIIPYKGSVNDIFEHLVSGLRRGMWYLGVKDLTELRNKSRIVLVTQSTKQENLPRI